VTTAIVLVSALTTAAVRTSGGVDVPELHRDYIVRAKIVYK